MSFFTFRSKLQQTLINKHQHNVFSFHTCHALRSTDWTKASLRRMKKTDLMRLAKENNLPAIGTKNDIVIQLLTHQSAKITGRAEPSTRITADKHSPISTMENQEEADDSKDQAWVNGFELKLANRGSGSSGSNSENHKKYKIELGVSQPHPLNNQNQGTVINSKEKKVLPPTEQVEVIHTVDDILKKEGINTEWVRAFDMKVGSRGSRRYLADTISSSATTKPIDKEEFASIFNKNKPSDSKEIKETVTDNENSNGSRSSKAEKPTSKVINKNTWVSTAVGSSMLIWYFGGSDGFSKIWHFLTSSS
ncbi:MAG: hypothetical protein EXX96DRAFT_621135 [Benjaminiella poitrasii]|nr:MAG: hypothetical protein EXX96DRAFT_621135 [Benjaminiella poitrasii]